MAGVTAPCKPSELFNLEQRKKVFEKERSEQNKNIPTIYRVHPLLRDLKSEHFDSSIIPLGLFDRVTRDHFGGVTVTKRMRIQLKIDVVVTFFEDTNMDLKDWMKVSEEVVGDPTAMKSLYNEHWLHSLEDEVVQSALALDAIFVTCFLSSAHVRFSSAHADWRQITITSLQKLPRFKALDAVVKKFLSDTLQNTHTLLSRESDSSVLKILQDILKLENQIPLSVIQNVIKIMYREAPRPAEAIQRDLHYHIEANDILGVICRRFVRTYKRIFPCLQFSETGLTGLPTDDGASTEQHGTNTRETPPANTSPTGTHLVRTQAEPQATDAASGTNAAAIGTTVTSIPEDSTPVTSVPEDSTPASSTPNDAATYQARHRQHQVLRTYSDRPGIGDETPPTPATPAFGAVKIRSYSLLDQNLRLGSEVQLNVAPQTTGPSQTTQIGTDFTSCHHLLHCLARVIWSKATHGNGATETQQNSHPGLGRGFLSCCKGLYILPLNFARKCFQACTDLPCLKGDTVEQRIPTAKELHQRGIQFKGQDGFSPRFERHLHWWGSATVYLPRLINIEDRTEECWRNLLAFEDAYYTYHQKLESKSFTSYMSWMSELISTKDDVAVLMERESPVILWNSTGDYKAIATLIKSVTKEHVPVEKGKWRKTRAEISEFHNHTVLRWAGTYYTSYFRKPWLLCSVIAAFTLLSLSAMQTTFTLKRYYESNRNW